MIVCLDCSYFGRHLFLESMCLPILVKEKKHLSSLFSFLQPKLTCKYETLCSSFCLTCFIFLLVSQWKLLKYLKILWRNKKKKKKQRKQAVILSDLIRIGLKISPNVSRLLWSDASSQHYKKINHYIRLHHIRSAVGRKQHYSECV